MELIYLWLIIAVTPLIMAFFTQIEISGPIMQQSREFMILAAVIFGLTFLFNLKRAFTGCHKKKKLSLLRRFGLRSSFFLPIFVIITGFLSLLVLPRLPVVSDMIEKISVMPFIHDLLYGAWLSTGSLIGYWIGRIFVGLC